MPAIRFSIRVNIPFIRRKDPDETNGQSGLPNIIDVPEAFVWQGKGPDAWQGNPVEMTPTQDGKDHVPSLKKV